jgi:hypothetical protein
MIIISAYRKYAGRLRQAKKKGIIDNKGPVYGCRLQLK